MTPPGQCHKLAPEGGQRLTAAEGKCTGVSVRRAAYEILQNSGTRFSKTV